MKNKSTHIIKEEKCSVGNIILRSDKILMFKPFDWATTANVEDLKEQYEICMEMTKGVPHLLYADNSNTKSFGSDERAYISSVFHHFASACAVKESSAYVRFLASYMKYLNKPKIPIELFKTELDAIKWLKSLNV